MNHGHSNYLLGQNLEFHQRYPTVHTLSISQVQTDSYFKINKISIEMDILLPWRQNSNRSVTGGDPKAAVGRGAGPAGGRGEGGQFPNNPHPPRPHYARDNSDSGLSGHEDGGGDAENNVAAVQARGGGGREGQRPNGLFNNFRFLDPQNLFRRDENDHQQRYDPQKQQFGRDPLLDNSYGGGAGKGAYNNPLLPSSLSSSPLQSVLDELNMSILPHDIRLSAVLKASQLFDHRDRTKHDYELNEGAARILYQKLAFVLTLCLQSNPGQNGRSYDSHSSYNMSVTQGQGLDMNTNVRINGVHANHNISDDEVSAAASATESSSHFNETASQSSRTLNTNPKTTNYIASNANTSIASMQRMRSTRSPQASDADYEIAVLAACLEMVHRASSEAIVSTWHSIGLEALPILVQLLERPFIKLERVVKDGSSLNQTANTIEKNLALAVNRENKLTVQKVTKILAVYSLIPEAKVAMATSDGLLGVLVKITDTHNLNRLKSMRPISKRIHNAMKMNSNNSFVAQGTAIATGGNGISGATAGAGLYMTEAARFNAIAVLTNLAAVEQNRMHMLSEPGLVDNIARVVHNERSDVARQCSSLAIMNLSNGDSEHVPELAGNELILETIVKLIRDDDVETRRNAAIALFNVACADENTVKLVRYKDGLILGVLMECLSISELSFPDELNQNQDNDMQNDVRTNAAEALFNISCSSIEETTDRMANHDGLLEALAITLRSPNGNKEVKLYCAATLRRMAEIIHAPKRGQLGLLSALVKASVWVSTTCIAEAYLSQAKIESNRYIMVQHNGLLNALAKLALSVGGPDAERIRIISVSAIEHLSRESGINREILSQHEGIMLAMTRASYLRTGSSSGTSTNETGSHLNMGLDYSTESSVLSQGDDQSLMTSSVVSSRRIQIALKHLVGAM
jgi:hypothetical protein